MPGDSVACCVAAYDADAVAAGAANGAAAAVGAATGAAVAAGTASGAAATVRTSSVDSVSVPADEARLTEASVLACASVLGDIIEGLIRGVATAAEFDEPAVCTIMAAPAAVGGATGTTCITAASPTAVGADSAAAARIDDAPIADNAAFGACVRDDASKAFGDVAREPRGEATANVPVQGGHKQGNVSSPPSGPSLSGQTGTHTSAATRQHLVHGSNMLHRQSFASLCRGHWDCTKSFGHHREANSTERAGLAGDRKLAVQPPTDQVLRGMLQQVVKGAATTRLICLVHQDDLHPALGEA